MKFLKNLVSAIMAGIMISIGGTVFLASESKLCGAVFFSLGLTVILFNGFSLFTGKTAYIFENKPSYLLQLLLIWVGNVIGTAVMGVLVGFSKPDLATKAYDICTKKLTQSPLQTIVLSVFCAILVYIAVDYFRNNKEKNIIPAIILVFTCIPVFILSGFEHSVADMFYFSLACCSSALYEGVVYILLVSFGNLLGAVAFHHLKKFCTQNLNK